MADFPEKFGKCFATFMRDESGATAIEYGLIASGIFLAIVLSVKDVASSVNAMYKMISSKVVESVL